MSKIGTRQKCIVVSSALRIVQNLATVLVSFVAGVGMNWRPFENKLTWLSAN